MGYLMAIEAGSFVAGPFLGAWFFTLGGYRFLFYTFGTIFALFSFSIKYIFDKSIDVKIEKN